MFQRCPQISARRLKIVAVIFFLEQSSFSVSERFDGTMAEVKARKALLSLENCILPEDKIQHTPSAADGISAEDEMELRILGCDFIQSAGILLKLPQVSAQCTGPTRRDR